MWPFRRKTSQAPRLINAKLDVAQTTANNRRHWANADGLSARAALSPAVRRVVRIRSRYEAENSSWYSGILRTAVNHIVGNGPRLQMLSGNPEANKRVESSFRRWATKIDLADMLRVIVEAYWRDGEVFVMRAERPQNWPLTLDLRTFEADQIASPWNSGSWKDDFQDDGIRFDRSVNELEFYVLNNHPGGNAYTSNQEGKWYSAKEVLHLFRAERPGQVHGIPRVTPALQQLPIMRRQELATLYSAETSANFAMYLKSTAPTIEAAQFATDFNEIEITSNLLTQLPPGWELGQVEPKQPGPQYEMFQRQALQSFCRCTNMPYTLAAGTGKDANFSSFKGDMKNVWEPEVKVEQSRIENSIIAPLFQWFLESAIYVPGLLNGLPQISEIDHKWHWPPLPTLDPVENANAAVIRLGSGLSTLTEEYALAGKDLATDMPRAAADFGVDEATYKAALFAKTFGLQPGQPVPEMPGPAAQAAGMPQGEYTTLGQRAFSNVQKRIKSALDQYVAGEITRVMAEQTLAANGLAPDRITALMEDAIQGGVEDTTIQEIAAALCFTAGGPGSGPQGGRATKKKEAGTKTKQQPMSDRVARAKAAHVMVDRSVQQEADVAERAMAKDIGGASFKNSEPVDIVVAGSDGSIEHGIEHKYMFANSNDKITMNRYAQVRKVEWEKKNKATFHTVVETKSGDIFYRRGVGSFRVGGMHKVTGGKSELKKLLRMADSVLPAAAMRTDSALRIGSWKPTSDGRGYSNSKTGEIVRPKK